MTLSPRHLEILQHAAGVDKYGRVKTPRNHFCAGGDDEPICRELVAMGLMWTWERTYLPYYNCAVTEDGKAAIKAHSLAVPKLTRSQQRYRDFLSADTGGSFLDWIKREQGSVPMDGVA